MALLALIFIFIFAVVVACMGLGMSFLKSKQKRQIQSMLRKAEASPVEQRSSLLVRAAKTEDAFSRLLHRLKLSERLTLFLEQAGQDWNASKFIFISCVAAILGFFVGLKLHFMLSPQITAPLFAAVATCCPLLYVKRKRAKNIAAFEEQFPEALDFLARSMRAGHGFSIALEMLSTDSPEPLASAFRRVSNEIQLGSPLEQAFKKLLVLIPLVDVRFFVSSVLLQQETGGNLGEILTKLASIIRERFRLKGQVKAASAHGRITGLVLVFMPIAVVGFMAM
ncbi:MAG: type II secretion system F family protein, partial [Acidobacteriaceae bacterium]|nr:type II secretion system F family protein [Acidobacteriaceae bacterium]